MATLRTTTHNRLAPVGNPLMMLCLFFLGLAPALQAAQPVPSLSQPVPTLAPTVPSLTTTVPSLTRTAPIVPALSTPAPAGPAVPPLTQPTGTQPPAKAADPAIRPIVLPTPIVPDLSRSMAVPEPTRTTTVPALAQPTAASKIPGNGAVPRLAPPNSAVPNLEAALPQVSDPQAQQPADQASDNSQQVQALIARAEAGYRSGVADYNAGKLDAARADFDAAVDAMLSSNLDLKGDPQLADEFDHLLSAINSLEVLALKQGNGFSPALEAAPVDAAAEVTFAPDPVLVSKVAAELKTTQSDFPLVINEYVAGWINAFTNKPGLHATLRRSIERAGKYKDMIQRILREQGVPQDLIYQAVTESGFQPQALNRSSGAGGMWQFMPQGGYGLARNGYFDERFDPEKSTLAYAKYMKVLYNMFGDWYLAMAAYDWGPGRVQHVVARTGYADYWEIYRHGNIPAETRAYIPFVIAAIIMARNPEQYGLNDLHPDAAILSDTVTTSYAIDMRLVADLTESTVQEIVALNPALLRLTTPRDISYDLHIPPGMRDVFLERVKEIPEDDRISWRFHIVKGGETLEQIALNLHARPTEIARANDITPAKPLEPEDELVIPIAAVSNNGEMRYTLRRADTLVTVADRFGITVDQLRTWNHLSSTRVAPGRSLYVTEPIRLAPGTGSVRGRHSRRGKNSSARGRSAHSRSSSRTSTSHAKKRSSRR